MRGRKPTPTALKLITGSRSLNRHEPKPACSLPTCPAHLNPSAKTEWKRLAHEMHRLGIVSQLDRAALAAYCQAYGRWVEAERKLKETPALIKLPTCASAMSDAGAEQAPCGRLEGGALRSSTGRWNR